MARFKADALGKLLEMTLVERKGAAAREKKLVLALNGLLGRMGYQVVERDANAPGRTPRRRRRRAGGRRGRLRGRRVAVKRGRKPGRPAKAQRKGRRRTRKVTPKG